MDVFVEEESVDLETVTKKLNTLEKGMKNSCMKDCMKSCMKILWSSGKKY